MVTTFRTQELDAWQRSQRGAAGIASLASTFAAGLSIARAVSAPASVAGGPSVACFVAGTPVLVPDVGEDDDQMTADMSQGDAPKAAKRNALLAGGMVLVGLSGLFVDERRARRKSKRREDAVDWLFGEYPEGEDGYDGTEPLTEARRTMQQLEDETNESVGPASPPALLVEVYPRALAGEVPRRYQGVRALSAGRAPNASDARSAPRATTRGRWWVGACLLLAALFAGKALLGTSSLSPRAYQRPRRPTPISPQARASRPSASASGYWLTIPIRTVPSGRRT